METVKKICLSCKSFRPEDVYTGRCRADKGSIEPARYPIMHHEDCCERWQNAGQQYYIRVGWVRRQKNKDTPTAPDHLL